MLRLCWAWTDAVPPSAVRDSDGRLCVYVVAAVVILPAAAGLLLMQEHPALHSAGCVFVLSVAVVVRVWNVHMLYGGDVHARRRPLS